MSNIKDNHFQKEGEEKTGKTNKKKRREENNREREIRLVIVNSSLTLSVLDKTRPLRKL